jgi:ankyrin repeat protein
LAAKNGHEYITKLLIDSKKIGVNSLDQNGETPLHKATKEYNESIGARFVKRFLLLADPGLVNASNSLGQTALHLAALNSDLQTVELLVQYGAQVRLRDKRGCTCLHYAAAESSPEVVEFLIRQDKSIVNYRDNRGRTPYHIAAMTRCYDVLVHLCEVSVVGMKIPDDDGCEPLAYAPRPNWPFQFSWMSPNTIKNLYAESSDEEESLPDDIKL